MCKPHDPTPLVTEGFRRWCIAYAAIHLVRSTNTRGLIREQRLDLKPRPRENRVTQRESKTASPRVAAPPARTQRSSTRSVARYFNSIVQEDPWPGYSSIVTSSDST